MTPRNDHWWSCGIEPRATLADVAQTFLHTFTWPESYRFEVSPTDAQPFRRSLRYEWRADLKANPMRYMSLRTWLAGLSLESCRHNLIAGCSGVKAHPPFAPGRKTGHHGTRTCEQLEAFIPRRRDIRPDKPTIVAVGIPDVAIEHRCTPFPSKLPARDYLVLARPA